MMPASDFSTYTDLANYIDDVYGDNYNWDSVDKWARQCWDDALKATGKTYKDEDRYESSYYTEYKCLLLASNFTGHFSAYGPKWTKEAGTFKDLQFAFVPRCILDRLQDGVFGDRERRLAPRAPRLEAVRFAPPRVHERESSVRQRHGARAPDAPPRLLVDLDARRVRPQTDGRHQAQHRDKSAHFNILS